MMKNEGQKFWKGKFCFGSGPIGQSIFVDHFRGLDAWLMVPKYPTVDS